MNRTLRLSLDDHRPQEHLVAVGHIANAEADEIAPTQLTVDGEIEHRQIANVTDVLKVNPDRPDRWASGIARELALPARAVVRILVTNVGSRLNCEF